MNANPMLELLRAIAVRDGKKAERTLKADPALATLALGEGATRQTAQDYFLKDILAYAYKGNTALHVAAAYQPDQIRKLVKLGADVRAKNRRGAEPLHAAVSGVPGTRYSNPKAQAATIKALIRAGADPDARAADNVTPLHRAVRNRCAAAVKALLDNGADPKLKNKSGSTAARLAKFTTGRGGSGSNEAKAQQALIAGLLEKV